MELVLIIMGLIYVLALIWNNVADDKDARMCSALLLTFSAIIFIILLLLYQDRNTPTAKSVYEGKTTLEITYRDSIPIDTIVVLKPEFIKK
jgi:hypothetical protein